MEILDDGTLMIPMSRDDLARVNQIKIGYAFITKIFHELKKGYWIYIESNDDRYDEIKCSCCHQTFVVDADRFYDIGFTIDDLKFCPNCGDMKEKE